MNTEKLWSRAKTLIDRNTIVESVPGSGFHDNDVIMGKPSAPQKRIDPNDKTGRRYLPRISEHCVAFYGERQVVFVGEHAVRVHEALKQYRENYKTAEAETFASYTGTQRKLLVEIPKLKVETTGDDGFYLVLWRTRGMTSWKPSTSRASGFPGCRWRADEMQGVRLPDETSPHLFCPGEYGLYQGEWYGRTPNGLLAGLARHSVAIGQDQSITVSPSILVKGGQNESWHGFLESGVWRECR